MHRNSPRIPQSATVRTPPLPQEAAVSQSQNLNAMVITVSDKYLFLMNGHRIRKTKFSICTAVLPEAAECVACLAVEDVEAVSDKIRDNQLLPRDRDCLELSRVGGPLPAGRPDETLKQRGDDASLKLLLDSSSSSSSSSSS